MAPRRRMIVVLGHTGFMGARLVPALRCAWPEMKERLRTRSRVDHDGSAAALLRALPRLQFTGLEEGLRATCAAEHGLTTAGRRAA